MATSISNLYLNLIPPDKLECDINIWNTCFTEDKNINLWRIYDGVPLVEIKDQALDYFFAYLMISVYQYKNYQNYRMHGVSIDNLIKLWFSKYAINMKGYFHLIN